MLSTLVTLFVVGVVTIFLLGIVLALVGALFSAGLGLAGFLLFKVLPILLIGWLVVRFLAPRRNEPADEFTV